VNKFVRFSTMCLVILLGLASTAFAQAPNQMVVAGSAIGVGLTVIGAAYGIGRLAGSAEAPLNVRLSAVYAIPGVVAAPQVAPTLQTFLQGSDNLHVRAAAADVLSRHGGCGLVRAQARRERDALTLQRAVQSCDKQ